MCEQLKNQVLQFDIIFVIKISQKLWQTIAM